MVFIFAYISPYRAGFERSYKMANLEEVLAQWQDVRDGLIKEVDLFPADRLDFRAAAETRTVLEVLHHVVESERVIIGELCRDDTNFRREPFPGLIARYAGHVKEAQTKEAIIELMRTSL